MTSPVLRAAVAVDFAPIRDVERSAGELFREIGMVEIADDDPPSDAELQGYADAGRAWVLADASDRAIGYVLVDVVDGNAHIEQLSVRRDHQGHGHGRRLIDHVATWARSRGMPAVTLTTFREVPWNAPYYARCGFRALAEAELTSEMVELRAREARQGLDPADRVCMRLDLASGPSDPASGP